MYSVYKIRLSTMWIVIVRNRDMLEKVSKLFQLYVAKFPVSKIYYLAIYEVDNALTLSN